MEIVVYKSTDAGSGFQTEHLALLQKLSDYKIAKDNLNDKILEQIDNSNRDEADIINLEEEVKKWDAKADYLAAADALDAKIAEVYPIVDISSPYYLALIPDENEYEGSSDVIFIYF